MRSKNTVDFAFSNAFLLILFFVTTAGAQTNSLGDAWKDQKKLKTVSPSTTPGVDSNQTKLDSTGVQIVSPGSATEPKSIQIKVDDAKAETAETVPVEPKVAPAMVSPARVKLPVNSTRLELPATLVPADELSGIGPAHTFQATAYSLPGRTRSGAWVRRGVLAADPRVLPLGTIVQLKAGNYSGVYTVHDTGGAIKGRIVDVWMPTSKEARIFGRRSIKLTVLKYGGTQKKRR